MRIQIVLFNTKEIFPTIKGADPPDSNFID